MSKEGLHKGEISSHKRHRLEQHATFVMWRHLKRVFREADILCDMWQARRDKIAKAA